MRTDVIQMKGGGHGHRAHCSCAFCVHRSARRESDALGLDSPPAEMSAELFEARYGPISYAEGVVEALSTDNAFVWTRFERASDGATVVRAGLFEEFPAGQVPTYLIARHPWVDSRESAVLLEAG